MSVSVYYDWAIKFASCALHLCKRNRFYDIVSTLLRSVACSFCFKAALSNWTINERFGLRMEHVDSPEDS